MSEKTDLQIEIFNDLKEEGLAFTGTLRRKSFGDYSITDGNRAITYVNHECYVVFTRLSKAFSLPKYVELREGDTLCICAANGTTPLKDDELVIDTETYSISLVIDMSAGTSSLFMLVVRK